MELYLRDHIKARGLSISAVAKQAGIARDAIYNYDSGKVDPQLSSIKNIVDAINELRGSELTIDDLFREPVIK